MLTKSSALPLEGSPANGAPAAMREAARLLASHFSRLAEKEVPPDAWEFFEEAIHLISDLANQFGISEEQVNHAISAGRTYDGDAKGFNRSDTSGLKQKSCEKTDRRSVKDGGQALFHIREALSGRHWGPYCDFNWHKYGPPGTSVSVEMLRAKCGKSTASIEAKIERLEKAGILTRKPKSSKSPKSTEWTVANTLMSHDGSLWGRLHAREALEELVGYEGEWVMALDKNYHLDPKGRNELRQILNYRTGRELFPLADECDRYELQGHRENAGACVILVPANACRGSSTDVLLEGVITNSNPLVGIMTSRVYWSEKSAGDFIEHSVPALAATLDQIVGKKSVRKTASEKIEYRAIFGIKKPSF